jgi:hypothetical protein
MISFSQFFTEAVGELLGDPVRNSAPWLENWLIEKRSLVQANVQYKKSHNST